MNPRLQQGSWRKGRLRQSALTTAGAFSRLIPVLSLVRELEMRFGVLTGGGDCPGLNGVIRAVVRKGVKEYGYDFVGFRDGWKGPLEGLTTTLDLATTRGILPKAEPSLVHLAPTLSKLRAALRRFKRISRSSASMRLSQSAAKTHSVSQQSLMHLESRSLVFLRRSITISTTPTTHLDLIHQ